MLKKYELTPQHREQLKPWADKWIANAMNCDPMSDVDKAIMIDSINGMYDAANLVRPLHIVFVSSPLVGQIASGFADHNARRRASSCQKTRS